MNNIIIRNEKGDKIFKCILENVIKKKENKNLKNLNDTLNSYLNTHLFDKGEKLFVINELNELSLSSFKDNKEINKALKKIKIDSDSELERILNSRVCFQLDEEDKDIMLVFFFNESVGVNYINLINDIIKLYNTTDLTCLIIAKSFTPSFNKEVNQINYTGKYNFISYTDEYFINIEKHSFSPGKPIIYRADEQLNLQGITKKELPKILVTDPYAKYYMLKSDDIIEFQRESGIENNLIEKHIVYRHVIVSDLDNNEDDDDDLE